MHKSAPEDKSEVIDVALERHNRADTVSVSVVCRR